MTNREKKKPLYPLLLRPHLKPIFQAIAAKVDGEPCCDWVGETGAGHYVKMVHNGIEYGDMQMICEAYQVLKDALGLTADELGDIFTEWNKGELDSYLIEITRDILKFKDVDGTPLVEKIKDTAGQVFYSSLFSWLYSRPGSSPPSASPLHPPSVHLCFMPSPSPRSGHPIEDRSIIATREKKKKDPLNKHHYAAKHTKMLI